MNEYIKIPFWISGIADIKSENITHFVDTIDCYSKSIDIYYLREYYKKNEKIFMELVDELSLRGFEFYVDKPNNLLKVYRYEKGEYILSNTKSNIFNIDFNVFDIGNFISRFNVKDNEFLNFIPLEGFKVLNPEIDLSEFKYELETNGFELRSFSLENKIEAIDKVSDLKHDEVCMESFENIEDENSLVFDEETSLEKFFYDNAFLTPMRYLNSIGIKSLSQITNETLINFCKTKGAGVTKVNNFVDKLIDIYQEKRGIIDINYNIFSIEFALSSVNFEDAREFFITKHGLSDISEIEEKHLELFLNQKNVTKTKVNKIKKVLEKFSSIERKEPFKREYILRFEGYYYDFLKDKKVIDIAKALEIPVNINENLLLSDINNIDLDEIDLFDSFKELDKILKIINNTKPINFLFEAGLNAIDGAREKEIIELRYIQGETLASIGKMLNITRERIRQVQVKGERKFTEYLLRNDIINALSLEFIGRDYCSVKELSKYLVKDKEFYYKVLLHNTDSLELFEPLNLIYFKNNNDIYNKAQQIIDKLPDFFKIYDELDYIFDGISSLGINNPELEEIESLLIYYGYRINGEYASKERITLYQVLDEILKSYIKEPIRVDDEGAKKITKIAKKYFNLVLDQSSRAIEARIRDNKNIILVDRLTFIHMDNYIFERKCLNKAFNYLNEIFNGQEIVNIEVVFNKFKDEFIKGGISNKLALYSLIQYYYGDEFKVGKGNTLDIYKDINAELVNRDEKIVELINNNGGVITKDEIIKSLGWAEFKLENAIVDSDIIVRYGKTITTIDNFKVSDEEKNEIAAVINKLMFKEGYTSTNLLLKEMMFNPKLGPFIKRNNIDSNEILAAVIKKLFNNLKGHSNFIYNEYSKFKTIEDVVKDKFKDTFYKEEVKDFVYSFGYKGVMVGRTLNNIIDQGIFIEISNDEFVNIDNFNIDDFVVDETVKYVNEQMGNKEYLVVSELSGYRRVLPVVDYKWNPYLIKSIVTRKGYKEIVRTFQDIRSEKVIVVRESSKIDSFADLLYYVISNEYEGNMHESKIYDFLAEKGLVTKQEFLLDKKMPYDLKISGKIKIDEVGRVELL